MENKQTILYNSFNCINWKRDDTIEMIEDELAQWVRKAEADNVPISVDVIRLKALRIAETHQYTKCKFSDGWFAGFKRRQNIGMVKCYGDSKRVDLDAHADKIESVKAEISKYHPDDIYNIDESALFFQLIPSRSFGTKGFKGFSQLKKRITICFAVNASGKHKLKPLVISSAKSPRCFKKFTYTNLIDYYNNENAWMTSKIFGDYLQNLDKKFNRKVLFLLDNFSGHILNNNTKLKNINLKFLPPGTTSLFQPLDAGIIKAFKSLYRSKVIQNYFYQYEENGTYNRVNLKEAILLLSEAWADLRRTSIKNCYLKTGLFECHREVLTEEEDADRMGIEAPSVDTENNSERDAKINLMLGELTASQINFAMIDDFEKECLDKEIELDILANELANHVREDEVFDEGDGNDLLQDDSNIQKVKQVKECIDLIGGLKKKLSGMDFIHPHNCLKLNSVLNNCIEQYYSLKRNNTKKTSLDPFIIRK